MNDILKLLRRHGRLLAFLLVVAATFGSIKISTERTLRRERDAQIGICLRVQFLRDQANGINFLVYDTFRQVLVQQRAMLDSGKLKGPARIAARQSYRRAQHVVNTTLVTGPTDCERATDQPNTYRAPAPQFIRSGNRTVRIARSRADRIVAKAANNEPLYTAEDFRRLSGD